MKPPQAAACTGVCWEVVGVGSPTTSPDVVPVPGSVVVVSLLMGASLSAAAPLVVAMGLLAAFGP